METTQQTRAFSAFLNQQVKLTIAEESAAITGVVKDYDSLGLVLEEPLTSGSSTPPSQSSPSNVLRCFYPWNAIYGVELNTSGKRAAA